MTVKQRQGWKSELGIGRKALANAIVKHPQLARLNPARVRDEWQSEIGISKEGLANAIVKFPPLADYSPARVRDEWQRELGISKEALANAIVKHPQLAGLSPARVRDEWQSELGIGKEALANAVVRFPQLAGLSLEKNLRPKKELLVRLGIQEADIANDLITFAPMNVSLLQLIYNIAQKNRMGMDKNQLIRAYKKINKKVNNGLGQSAVSWIKQHKLNKWLIEPLVNKVLGISHVHTNTTQCSGGRKDAYSQPRTVKR